MMGLGYLGNGVSSSSSSNLSPLAPPFTVDRSNSKPNLNPQHYPPLPFSSPMNSWQYPHSSSSSRLDFFPSHDLGLDSIRTTSLASPTDFCYEGSESTTNPWSLQNPSRETGTDKLSYFGVPKPYYSPYISPVTDDDAPLMSLTQPGYDLLSTSGFLTMDERVDYTQSLSGLEYAPQWGGLWNGSLTEGKRTEVDGEGFLSDEINVAGSLAYKNYTKQGGACELDSAITQGNYVDVFGRENHAGSSSTGQLQDKSFVAQNHMSIPVESSKPPVLRSGSVLSESLMEPATFSWNNQKPYNGPYEKQFKLFDSCMKDSAPLTKSSPAAVPLSIRPPAVGIIPPISAPLRTVSSIAVDTGEDISSKTKEEKSNNQLTKNESSSSYKAGSAFHVSDINIMDGFLSTVESSDAVAANSSESLDSPCWKGAPAAAHISSSFDAFEAVHPQQQHQYQHQHLITKKLEVSSSSSHSFDSREGGIHIFPPYDDSLKAASAQQVFGTSCQNDSTCLRDNSSGLLIPPKISWDTNLITKEHYNNSGDNAPKNNSSCTKGIQSINNMKKPRNEYDVVANESKCDSDSKSYETKQQLGVEVDSLTSQRIILKSEGVTHEKTSGKELPPEMDVHMLVNVMRNLSELLLFRCSHEDGCALDKQDVEALNHVSDNLGSCRSMYTKKKKIVHMTPTQQEPTTFPEGTSPQLGVLSDKVGGSAGRHKEMNDAGRDCCEAGHQFIAAEGQRNDVSVKKVEKKYAQLITTLSDDVVLKDHNIIQDIKKVLDEDFEWEEELESDASLFKDLWLEAEAELCISNYRSRFDRIKKTTEVEKCNKLGRAKDAVLQKDMHVAEKQSSSTSTTPGDPKTSGLETSMVCSPDPNVNLLAPKVSHEESNITRAPRPEEEAADSSYMVPQKTSIINTSAAANSTRSKNSDSLRHHADVDNVEESVMARFQILKCRLGSNNFSDTTEEEEQEFADDRPGMVIGTENNKNFQVAVGPSQFKDRSSAAAAASKKGAGGYDEESEKEFLHVCVTDDPVVLQRPYHYTWNNNNSSNNAASNSSLDWEHVLKDDFAPLHN